MSRKNKRFTQKTDAGYRLISEDPAFVQKALERLAMYEELDEANRLVQIPCEAAAEIYAIRCGQIEKYNVQSIEVIAADYVIVEADLFDGNNHIETAHFEDRDFGNTVFLTFEEAARMLSKTEPNS